MGYINSPFGLQGAPATFQRMMDILLNDAGAYAAAYLDNVIIYSKDWRDHVQHVKDVLSTLKNAGQATEMSLRYGKLHLPGSCSREQRGTARVF